MNIIEDTRQQSGKHDRKHEYFEQNGISVVRCKLPYGDYALVPSTSVDTKKDIYELAQDIDADHKRFKAECVNARDNGCKLIILVENLDGVETLTDLMRWEEPDVHFDMRVRKSHNTRARKISGMRLARACATMSERYGVQFEFCTPEESAKRIIELLERREHEQ